VEGECRLASANGKNLMLVFPPGSSISNRGTSAALGRELKTVLATCAQLLLELPYPLVKAGHVHALLVSVLNSLLPFLL
jgi:hypothetical protein